MFRDPEQERIPLKIGAGFGGVVGMGAFGVTEAIRSANRRDGWLQRIDDLKAHVEKTRKDLNGPFHHLAAVDIGETQQAIAQARTNPPQGPEGVQVLEGMAPFILVGATIAITAIYAVRHMPVIGKHL